MTFDLKCFHIYFSVIFIDWKRYDTRNLLKRLVNIHCLLLFLQDELPWKQTLLQYVYLYMARALFKEDTLAFALHLAHTMCPSLFQTNVSKIWTSFLTIKTYFNLPHGMTWRGPWAPFNYLGNYTNYNAVALLIYFLGDIERQLQNIILKLNSGFYNAGLVISP